MSFACLMATLVHTALYYRGAIWTQAWRGLHDENDIHSRLMRKYREVPLWWYAGVFLVNLAMGESSILLADYLNFELTQSASFVSSWSRLWLEDVSSDASTFACLLSTLADDSDSFSQRHASLDSFPRAFYRVLLCPSSGSRSGRHEPARSVERVSSKSSRTMQRSKLTRYLFPLLSRSISELIM